jgi:hypothetical protein
LPNPENIINICILLTYVLGTLHVYAVWYFITDVRIQHPEHFNNMHSSITTTSNVYLHAFYSSFLSIIS